MHTHIFNIIGCGYIGKRIAQRLQQHNQAVKCYVATQASQDACAALGLDVQRFNLDEPGLALPESSQQDFSSSVLMYLVPPPRNGRVDTRMSNFIDYLQACEKSSGQPVQKIVLISTTGIYGDCDGEWIDESRSPSPQADRAYRRLDAETQLQAYCAQHDIDCIVFRVPGIYAMDKLPLKRITSGEPIVRAEDSGYTNRIHADDLAAFCVEAMTEPVAAGVYNCCDGNPSTMNDYFLRVAEVMDLPAPSQISLQQAQAELSPGMLSYLAESKRISNEKLRRHFKTEFQYPDLQAGLKK
jgi:nucleoside-diphosphate-sugar epimerase